MRYTHQIILRKSLQKSLIFFWHFSANFTTAMKIQQTSCGLNLYTYFINHDTGNTLRCFHIFCCESFQERKTTKTYLNLTKSPFSDCTFVLEQAFCQQLLNSFIHENTFHDNFCFQIIKPCLVKFLTIPLKKSPRFGNLVNING